MSSIVVPVTRGPAPPAPTPTGTVTACYSAFDYFFPACGLFDLTEGIYGGDPAVAYDRAQANQHGYLLDQLRCGPGSRVLDVGCGYGTLLNRARGRGAEAVGITLSREQARRCRGAGLDVRLVDYKALGGGWDRSFDGVVANGSAEHFVRPADAATRRADAVYRDFFRTAHRLIDPRSPSRRLVTTVIHFERRPDPADLLRSPLAFRRGSDEFHYALLARTFGGWYPVPGQLRRCAAGYFEPVEEVDGTDDYRRTSEEWLARVRRILVSPRGVLILSRALPGFLRHPIHLPTMLYALLVSQSWNWQFRPPNPPTRLLRQTWEYLERSTADRLA